MVQGPASAAAQLWQTPLSTEGMLLQSAWPNFRQEIKRSREQILVGSVWPRARNMNAFSWLNRAPVQRSAYLRKTVSLEDTHAPLGVRLCRVSAPALFPCSHQARGTAPVRLGTSGRMLRADPPSSTVCCVNACAFPRGAVLQRKA